MKEYLMNRSLHILFVFVLLAGLFGSWATPVSAAPDTVWTFSFYSETTIKAVPPAEWGTNPITVEKWDLEGTHYVYSQPYSWDAYYVDVTNVESFVIRNTADENFNVNELTGWEIGPYLFQDGSHIIRQVPTEWSFWYDRENEKLEIYRYDEKTDPILIKLWSIGFDYQEQWITYTTSIEGYIISSTDLNNFAVTGAKEWILPTDIDALWVPEPDTFLDQAGSFIFMRKEPIPCVEHTAMSVPNVAAAWFTPGAGSNHWGRFVILIPRGESFKACGLGLNTWVLNPGDDPMAKIYELRENYAANSGVGIDEIPILTIVREPVSGQHILDFLDEAPAGPLFAIHYRFVVTTPATPYQIFMPLTMSGN